MPYLRHPELAILHIERVTFDAQDAHFHLRNGQCFSLPLGGYLRLDRLTLAQRQDYRLEHEGFSVSWQHHGASQCDSSDLAWDDLQDQALRRLDAAGWELDALSLRDRHLVALWRLQADYYNGGLMQFFANWGMPTFESAQHALTLIGEEAACQVLQNWYAVFAHLQDEPEEIALWDICAWLNDEQNARLEALDERFGEVAEHLPWSALHYFYLIDPRG